MRRELSCLYSQLLFYEGLKFVFEFYVVCCLAGGICIIPMPEEASWFAPLAGTGKYEYRCGRLETSGFLQRSVYQFAGNSDTLLAAYLSGFSDNGALG